MHRLHILAMLMGLMLATGCEGSRDIAELKSDISDIKAAIAERHRLDEHRFSGYGRVVHVETVAAPENCLGAKANVIYYIQPLPITRPDQLDANVTTDVDLRTCIRYKFWVTSCENPPISGPTPPDFEVGERVYIVGSVMRMGR